MASATTTQPGRLTAPLYATGASGTDEPSDTWNLESGFGCLPTDVEGDNLILTHKLEVFNCLFLATPYDFWATSAEGLKADPRFNTWLDYGDWVCTDPAPEGPVVSCRKHDVAYGSLKKFVGDSADDDTLDEAWNPRNKALADAEFFSDVAFHGCDQQSGVPAFILCGTRTNVELARIYFWGVAKYNTKGWPVTVEDLWHFYLEPKFIECNGVPRLHVTGDVVTRKPNGSYTVEWQLLAGCVPHIAIESYKICLAAGHRDRFTLEDVDCVTDIPGFSRSASFTLNLLSNPREVPFTLVAYLQPQNVAYGVTSYYQTVELALGH